MRHEERRISAIFQRAILLAMAAPTLAACADAGSVGPPSTSPPGTVGDAGSDATTTQSIDGGLAFDGGLHVDDGGICASHLIASEPVDTCGNYVRLPCGVPQGVVPRDNCYFEINDCASICPDTYFNCHAIGDSCLDGGAIVADDAGGVTVDCAICLTGVGRIPAGLASGAVAVAFVHPSPVGAYFARASHFEAASVHAFRRLRRELAQHAAPPRLLRAARRAERDEARHARLTARAARRFGAAPITPRVHPVAARALDAVALENAVEGCVRETFGALVLHVQAAAAGDRAVATMLAEVARDETRHAALSWSVAAWASPRVDAASRARIAAACAVAIAELRRGVDAAASIAPDAELARVTGLPSREVSHILLNVLEADLFATLPRA